jgi:heme exporter protein D
MIEEIIFMKGYGLYVWSAFSFTLISFATLYVLIKINLVKEQNKFTVKFGLLNDAEVKVAKAQSTNREILLSRISSKI